MFKTQTLVHPSIRNGAKTGVSIVLSNRRQRFLALLLLLFVEEEVVVPRFLFLLHIVVEIVALS
jgi:hypothetical protein